MPIVRATGTQRTGAPAAPRPGRLDGPDSRLAAVGHQDARQPATAESRVAASAPRRPLPVSIAVVAIMVLAGLGVLEGVLILLTRYDAATIADGLVMAVSLAGAAGILLSLLLGAVAAAVWRGSRAARIAVTVVAGGAVLLDVITILGSPTQLWWTVLDAVFYALVIVALWAGRPTSRFFTRRGRAIAASAGAA